MDIPVRVGQRVTLPIHGITHDAEGVGKHMGFTIFVPGAIPGDEVEVEVISVKKQYARALIYSFVVESPDRVTPICSH